MSEWSGDEQSLSATEIARMLDFSVSTVSNWRKRFSDFPQPDAAGRFSADEVSHWLRVHDRAPLEMPSSPPDSRKAAMLDTAREGLPRDLRTPVLLTLTTLLGLVPGVGPESGVWGLLDSATDAEDRGRIAPGALTGILNLIPPETDLVPLWREAVAGLDASRDVAGTSRRARAAAAFRALAERRGALGRKVGDTSPSPELNGLIASLMPSNARTILDPAAGLGFLLLDAARPTGARVTAIDINPVAASLCAQNLALNTLRAQVHHGDAFALAPDLGTFDAVVVQPPLGMRVNPGTAADDLLTLTLHSRSSDQGFAWLSLAIASLRQGGLAAVVTNRSSLTQQRDAGLRRRLLHDRCVHAVIGLPPRYIVGSTAPAALWLVGTSSPDRTHVLFIDGSDTDPSDFAGLARDAYHRWTNRPSRLTDRDGFAGSIDVRHILAEDNASLDPTARAQTARQLTPPRARGRLIKRTQEMQRHLADTRSRLLELSRRYAKGTTHNIPLPRAEELGLLRVLRPRLHGTTTRGRHIGALGPSSRLLESRDGDRRSITTEPGDVIVQMGGPTRAAVDVHGGERVCHPLLVLRSQDPRVDPHLLALTLEAADRLGSSAFAPRESSSRSRLLPTSLTIPLVDAPDTSSPEAKRVYELSRSAQALEYNARRLGEEFIDAIRAGSVPDA